MSIGYCRTCEKLQQGQSRGEDFQCSECGNYTSKRTKVPEGKTESVHFQKEDYSAQFIVTSEKRVLTENEIVKKCNIDLNTWKIDKIVYGGSEANRKDRKVSWEIVDGKTTSGKVDDSGKLLIVPLHSYKVFCSRKTDEIRSRLVIDDFTKEAKKYAPKYKKIKYPKKTGEYLFELALPDMQLGRLVAQEETGKEITPQVQIEIATRVVDELILFLRSYSNVSRILFPVGNDYFDANSSSMTTAHGTPMQDDVRWQRTYKLGCKFIVDTIEKLMQFAPVDVVVVRGNHDEDSIFHLGEYLDAWFSKCPNVVIDNLPKKRKYYAFGKNLLGLTHGYHEKVNKLDGLMAYEVPQLWAQSVNREWHLGDKHHKVDMILKTNEMENGVVVRILRSLADSSVWEFDKGLVGSLKAGEAFLWHEEDGVVAQFTSRCK